MAFLTDTFFKVILEHLQQEEPCSYIQERSKEEDGRIGGEDEEEQLQIALALSKSEHEQPRWKHQPPQQQAYKEMDIDLPTNQGGSVGGQELSEDSLEEEGMQLAIQLSLHDKCSAADDGHPK